MSAEYPYWGQCEVARVANGWIVRSRGLPHVAADMNDCWVFGDLQWDACQDFIRAVTTERPSAHSGTSHGA